LGSSSDAALPTPTAATNKKTSIIIDKIDYTSVKEDFEKWIHNRIGKDTAKSYVSYLDRYLTDVVIEDLDDLVDISSTVKKGWNPFAKSVRNLINYSREKRLISKEWGIELKEALKIKKNGTDTFVPSDETVRSVLRQCTKEEMKLWNQSCRSYQNTHRV
jgi:intergrase/recombinase